MFAVIQVTIADDPWVLVPSYITLLLLIVAAIIAWRQVGEARRTREEQARPYVVVDFDVKRPPFFNLVIENTGNTEARDLTFECSPSLESSFSHDSAGANLLEKRWSSLAPHKRIETLFDSAFERFSPQNPLPTKYTIKARYRGPFSTKNWYEQTVELDLKIYEDLTFIGTKYFDDLVKTLEQIESTLRRWNHNDAINVLTSDRAVVDRNREEALKRAFEARRAAEVKREDQLPGSDNQ